MDTNIQEKVKEYWQERAGKHSGGKESTTNDVWLRELEVSAMIDALRSMHLPADARVLDVGCGDGYSTLRIAQAMPSFTFQGIDYSEAMIRIAQQRLETERGLESRACFSLGDVTSLGATCGATVYDVVLSDRCLINLGSLELQREATAQIARHMHVGAVCVLIENFTEGHDNMNAARSSVGLESIPVRWHNLYFREPEFVDAAARYFEDIQVKEFASSYYFATRVIYAAMCQMRGEAPDYQHEIHRLGVKLPWIGQFSPVRMVVMRRK